MISHLTRRQGKLRFSSMPSGRDVTPTVGQSFRNQTIGMAVIQNTEAQLQPAPSKPDPRRSILIVDDDAAQVEVLSHRLQQQGFSIVFAYEGRAGLSKAREHRPDLVLLDVTLPDLDGFAVCEELVDSPETSDIPIIIVSGSDRADIVRSSRSVGCEFFVHKPYDPNALLALIEHALKRRYDWET